MRTTKIIISLLLLICVYITVNFFWLEVDTNPPNWDTATHAYISVKYSQYLHNHSIVSFFNKISRICPDRRYPPLMHLAVLPFFAVSGIENVDMATLAMDIVFLPILIFSVFGIGKNISGDKTGFFAAFVVMMFPFVITLSRYFLLEFVLLSMAALVLYFYLKSDDFNQGRYSLLFGISSGLGLLAKPTFVLYVVPIFTYSLVIILSAKNKAPASRKQLRNFIFSLFAVFLVSGWWYLQNLGYILKAYRIFGINDVIAKLPFFIRYLIVDYLNVLVSHISSLLAILFLFTLVLFIKRGPKQKWFLLFWLVASILLQMTIRLRDPRYLAPVLPVCALIIACGIFAISNQLCRRIIIISVFIFGAIGFYRLSLCQQAAKIGKPRNKMRRRWYSYSPYPHMDDWKIEEVLSVIKRENSVPENHATPSRVLLGCDDVRYNFSTFRYYIELEHINASPLNLAVSGHPANVLDEGRYDLLVYKTAGRLLPVVRYINMNPGKFTIVYNELLPDKTRVIIYKLIK